MNPQLKIIIWIFISLLMLGTYKLCYADDTIVEYNGYVVIPVEKFKEMAAYTRQQERLIKHYYNLSGIYKQMYFGTKECAINNALIGTSVLVCFNRNTNEDLMVFDSEMQRNVTEF